MYILCFCINPLARCSRRSSASQKIVLKVGNCWRSHVNRFPKLIGYQDVTWCAKDRGSMEIVIRWRWSAKDRLFRIEDHLPKIYWWSSTDDRRLIWKSYMCIFYRLRFSWVKRHSDWLRYHPISRFFLRWRRVPFGVPDVPRNEQFRTFLTNKTLITQHYFSQLNLGRKKLKHYFYINAKNMSNTTCI